MAQRAWMNIAANAAPIDAEARFAQLADAEWAWRLAQFPQLATRVGEHRHDHRLERVDPASRHERLAYWRATRAALDKIPAAEMSLEGRINRAVFSTQIDAFIADIDVHADLMPFNSNANFFSPLADLPDHQPLLNGADYHRYLARLADIPRYFTEHVALMSEGMRTGFTLPRLVLPGIISTLEAMAAVTDPERSPFFRPFLEFPATAPAAERTALRAQARNVIAEEVLPAHRRLLAFLRETYLPAARLTTGAGDLPHGDAFYAAQIHKFTGLALSPEEIHARGKAEVARIQSEMRTVLADVGFQGGIPAFLHFLRTDPQFYARTPDELLAHVSWIAKRIDGLLPKYFGHLPRQPWGVAAVPADLAPYHAPGRYVPALQPEGAAGTFWVNTFALPSRPLYALPALTLHEAVPGHHLQIALAAERESQPAFRRYGYVDACGEGWALYAEHLGNEMGVYLTPYEQFGRLTCEMWRACRLVVDTGLHAMQWGRDDARAYLLAHTALSELEVTTEVDRYISWPGQALAFKIGELKIRELRERGQARLGARFDLRAFHDAVLALGSVPLSVLEAQVDRWIARRLQQ